MSDAIQRLRDALDAAYECRSYTRDTTYAEFVAERMRRRAVERVLEILGEALGQAVRADPELPQVFPDVRVIVGMRNRLAHGYDQVDEEVVWDTATRDIPELIVRLDTYLRDRLPEMSPVENAERD